MPGNQVPLRKLVGQDLDRSRRDAKGIPAARVGLGRAQIFDERFSVESITMNGNARDSAPVWASRTRPVTEQSRSMRTVTLAASSEVVSTGSSGGTAKGTPSPSWTSRLYLPGGKASIRNGPSAATLAEPWYSVRKEPGTGASAGSTRLAETEIPR